MGPHVVERDPWPVKELSILRFSVAFSLELMLSGIVDILKCQRQLL
jgi:hypothetical protein